MIASRSRSNCFQQRKQRQFSVLLAPQQEHCQCAAFISRSPRDFERVDAHGLDAVELRGFEGGVVVAGGDHTPVDAVPHTPKRRSDLHCALSHRGRRDADRLSRKIISAICWSASDFSPKD
jgi:hypothetical protein